MKLIFLFLFLLFNSIDSYEEYQLSFEIFLSGDKKFDLYLINGNQNLFYSGKIENIEEILYKNSKINEKNKNNYQIEGNYPLIYILDKNYIKYINLFPINTIFVIPYDYIGKINNSYDNYTIFSLLGSYFEFEFYSSYLKKENFYYVKIGKKSNETTQNNLNLFLFLNIFISLGISLIIRNAIKKVEQEDHLPIHFLIKSISDILFITNLLNNLSLLFFKDKEYFYVIEFMLIFIYSFYKSIFYASMILILLGFTTISFYGWGPNFKKINLKILIYDLIFSTLILLSIYFFNITSKLNLFYIKNISEHFALLCFTIYCIIKKVIPLGKQANYEQSIRSDLVKCIKFKFRRLLFSSFIMLAYTIFFLNTPFLDKKYIYHYIDNFNFHIIFQLFYENIFLIFLVINFYPKKLPINYFDEIVFNYKKIVYLLANISEKQELIKNLNISNLNFQILTKLSKKNNYPLVLVNPYASSKNNSLFKNVHIGTIQKYKKEN